MPAKAKTLEKVAKKLGFEKLRQKGSHARWKHPVFMEMLKSVVGYSRKFLNN
jgi:predicted RNA binding protein YcfA (HicA-like mRNA interferase family)